MGRNISFGQLRKRDFLVTPAMTMSQLTKMLSKRLKGRKRSNFRLTSPEQDLEGPEYASQKSGIFRVSNLLHALKD